MSHFDNTYQQDVFLERSKWAYYRLLLMCGGALPPPTAITGGVGSGLCGAKSDCGCGGRTHPTKCTDKDPKWIAEFEPILNGEIINRYLNIASERKVAIRLAYRAVVADIYSRFKDIVTGAIMQNGAFVAQTQDPEFAEYLNGLKIEGYELRAFIQAYMISGVCIAAPSALCVLAESPNDESKTPIVSIVYVPMEMMISSVKSGVFEFKRIDEQGKIVYYKIDKTNIYKKENGSDVYTSVYSHNLGYIPAIHLGVGEHCEPLLSGKISQMLAVLRQAAHNEMDAKDMVTVRHIVTSQCPHCQNGYITSDPDPHTGHQSRIKCGHCDGGGIAIIQQGDVIDTPLSDLANQATASAFSTDFVRYYAPPPTVESGSRERLEYLKSELEKSLFIKYIEEAQSGTAKSLDRDEYYKLVSVINNIIRDCIVFALTSFLHIYEIGRSANPKKPEVTLTVASDFEIANLSELQKRFVELYKQGAPPFVLLDEKRKIYATQGDARGVQIINILEAYNPFYGSSPMSIAELQTIQAITARDLDIITKGEYVLRNAFPKGNIEKNAAFLKLDKAFPLSVEQTQEKVQDIKAPGSISQAVVEIVQSKAKGLIDEEAAALLITRLAPVFTKEEALRIVQSSNVTLPPTA